MDYNSCPFLTGKWRHTESNAPILVKSMKLNGEGLIQYLDEQPYLESSCSVSKLVPLIQTKQQLVKNNKMKDKLVKCSHLNSYHLA